jgi:DNA repair photolyase
MSLVKSKGNMYDWVTHMHSHLAGECPHRCSYCYVQRGVARLSGKYNGPVRLLPDELEVCYGKGKTIFVDHMNDLFAAEVSDRVLTKVLDHTKTYPDNIYVFQTKNPGRAWLYRNWFPPEYMIGTTIETDRDLSQLSRAPYPAQRACGIALFAGKGVSTFITIEPVMDFHSEKFPAMIIAAWPQFVNIGADSKRSYLDEPSPEKLNQLILDLTRAGVAIRKKHNLGRILGGQE